MKVLKSLTDQLADYITENGKLDNMEITGKEELDRLLKTGDADLNDPQILRRVTEAQARIALVPPRRKKIAALIDYQAARVSRYRAHLVENFSTFISGQMEKRFDDFIEAVLPFWEHKRRDCRRRFEQETIPHVEELRCWFFNHFDPEMTPEKEVEVSRCFLEHTAKCCKRFGWTEADWNPSDK